MQSLPKYDIDSIALTACLSAWEIEVILLNKSEIPIVRLIPVSDLNSLRTEFKSLSMPSNPLSRFSKISSGTFLDDRAFTIIK